MNNISDNIPDTKPEPYESMDHSSAFPQPPPPNQNAGTSSGRVKTSLEIAIEADEKLTIRNRKEALDIHGLSDGDTVLFDGFIVELKIYGSIGVCVQLTPEQYYDYSGKRVNPRHMVTVPVGGLYNLHRMRKVEADE